MKIQKPTSSFEDDSYYYVEKEMNELILRSIEIRSSLNSYGFKMDLAKPDFGKPDPANCAKEIKSLLQELGAIKRRIINIWDYEIAQTGRLLPGESGSITILINKNNLNYLERRTLFKRKI